jgi:hypothetical protein
MLFLFAPTVFHLLIITTSPDICGRSRSMKPAKVSHSNKEGHAFPEGAYLNRAFAQTGRITARLILSIKQHHMYQGTVRKYPMNFCFPDCCLEVSVHPEAPATGHLNKGFLDFPVFRQLLRRFPSCYCVLLTQSSRLKLVKIKLHSCQR